MILGKLRMILGKLRMILGKLRKFGSDRQHSDKLISVRKKVGGHEVAVIVIVV